MLTSNLTAFAFIPERAEATPGLWNRVFSQLSDNIRSASEGPFSISSGQTVSLSTNIEVVGAGHFQSLSVGSTPPSYLTTAAVTIEVNSSTSDYLYMVDSSGQRSSYVIGSRAGNTGDGLNIWDASGSTMIVGFSKQSTRFYSPVVGFLTDLGGAVYNVKSYGAKGDDTTDDGGTIRLAISAATSAGGGTIYFPPGTYKITSQLTVATDIQVLMQPGSVIKQYTEAEPCFVASGTSGVKFRDCVLDYNTTAVRQSIGAIYVVDSTNFEIIGCQVKKAAGMGFYTANNARGRILSNIVQNSNADGIHVNNGGNSNNSSRDISIVNNIVSKTSDDGISVIGYTSNSQAINEAITITGNVISQCSTRAITVSGGRFVTVAANTVRANIGNRGINIILDETFSTFSSENIVVANNVIEPASGAAASTRHGISIYRSPRVTVIGNSVDWQFGEGIMVFGTSAATVQDVQIIGNNVRGSATGEQGIHLQYVRGAIVQGNSIISVAKSGVYVEQFDDVVISDNQIDDANQQNIGATNLFTVISGTRATIKGNLIRQATTNFQHAYAISTVTDVYSANNMLRKSVTMSGETVSPFSVASADLWDYVGTSAGIPPLHTNSELSLGWYRSAASTLALSYGTLYSPLVVAPTSLQSFVEVGNAFGTKTNSVGLVFGTDTTGSGIEYLISAGGNGYNYRLFTVDKGGGATNFQITQRTNSASALTAGMIRTEYVSDGVAKVQWLFADGAAIFPTSAFTSETSLGLFRSGVSTIALSYGTLNLAKQAVRLSMRTLAASAVTASAAKTNVAVDEVVFTVGAGSGATLLIYSGGTVYGFNSTFSIPAA